MIEHVSVPVSNVRKSKAFYTKALKPLGYEPWMAYADAVGFVEGGHARLWIGKQETVVPMHVAFLGLSRLQLRLLRRVRLRPGRQQHRSRLVRPGQEREVTEAPPVERLADPRDYRSQTRFLYIR
jgi:catechol 2,3-dioxygenase-like lactoylglutathione lyase family enzyme